MLLTIKNQQFLHKVIYENIQSSVRYVSAVERHLQGENLKHVNVNYLNQLWIDIKLSQYIMG
jgi:hypothetical protein